MRVFRTVAAAEVVALAAIGLATVVAAPPAAAGKSTITGQFDVSWGGDGFQELQGTMAAITLSTGAREVWARTDGNGQKITGKGVGVAVVDSGIAPVTGLADPARVVNGPDLSFESQSPNLRYLDTFGHGTHMAGIIAGRDPNLSDAQLPTTPSFVGMAPGARLVDMKVAAADGSVDVSQVIAAIDWVVAHRRSVISLRDPGSYIDTNYPTGLVPGDTTGRFFRGSGTSQATAVVSGAAALLLQQRPTLTPDQVKKLLTSTADPMPKADPI